MATAILKLATAFTLLVLGVCLAGSVFVWASHQLADKDRLSRRLDSMHKSIKERLSGEPQPILARRWLDAQANGDGAAPPSHVVVGVAQVDPWAPLTLNNVLPVELDMASGTLRLSNGQPLAEPDGVSWTPSGRKLWEQCEAQ
jgi:hypothetical protein